MDIANAYSTWAARYDTDRNLTRDLDAAVTREVITPIPVDAIVEAGCGTGKNTRYFSQLARAVHALDFSPGMLAVARQRVAAPNVTFAQVDLSADWPCASGGADWVSFNLVLEHIQDVAAVLREATRVLRPGGRIFVSELHPYKQYQNSQARFLDANGDEVKVTAYTHNISDFLGAAERCGLRLLRLNEWWHPEDPGAGVPRLVSFVFGRVP
jgi:malonyl-CoA O-methyltransferase